MICWNGQERETYRYPVKESVKSMLAMNWTIERTKEGEAMFQQREAEKHIKISDSSHVRKMQKKKPNNNNKKNPTAQMCLTRVFF